MLFFTRPKALGVAAVSLLAIASIAPVASHTTNNTLPGRYIVLLKPDTIASVEAHYHKVHSIHARYISRRDSGSSSAGIKRKYQLGNFQGYAGSFDDDTIKELKALPEVLSVEPDRMIELSSVVTQNPAPYNLALLSSSGQHRDWLNELKPYAYDDSAGRGTFSYVLDSGIRLDHSEFGGRAIFGFNAFEGSSNNDDETGHGTHVAGIIGGTRAGVAKRTTLISVKALADGGQPGTISTLLEGLLWAAKDIVTKKRQKTAVINASFSSPGYENAWDWAITELFQQGVLVVVAAGNSHEDAANVAPCRSPEAICVGAAGNGVVASYSNYGPVVDIFAPGTKIVSASHLGRTNFISKSGTSMAAPHVAGLVSYLRGLEGPSTAAAITARIYDLARKNVLGGKNSGNNLLIHNGLVAARKERMVDTREYKEY